MKSLISLITLDYLQRIKNYNFLIIACCGIAFAYSFVPEPNATYSTINISGYRGIYNSYWFGYVTAIMASVFLSLVGYYLINSGIAADERFKVSSLIATSSISNRKYVFVKFLSNSLILASILFLVLVVSIVLFFLYHEDPAFSLMPFLKPFVLVSLPSILFVSALGVVFEITFGKYTVIQNILFFFCFSAILVLPIKGETQKQFDLTGTKTVTEVMERDAKNSLGLEKNTSLNIGFSTNTAKDDRTFEFKGVNFSLVYVTSRIGWLTLALLLVFLSSLLFHRFSLNPTITNKVRIPVKSSPKIENSGTFQTTNLVDLKTNFSVLPLVRAELLMLLRKGKKWLWIVNIVGIALLAFLPLAMAYSYVLPILWFLQVSRISDLTAKESLFNTKAITMSSYRPVTRLLSSQLISGVLLLIIISFPLLVRLLFSGAFTAAFSIIVGGFFIILLSMTLGVAFKNKKLFEVVFFALTYTILNGITFTNYMEAFEGNYFATFIFCTVLIAIMVFIKKKR